MKMLERVKKNNNNNKKFLKIVYKSMPYAAEVIKFFPKNIST